MFSYMKNVMLGKISKNSELAGTCELQGYRPELRSRICGSKLEMKARLAHALESELHLIRAALAEAREALDKFQQKAAGKSKSVT